MKSHIFYIEGAGIYKFESDMNWRGIPFGMPLSTYGKEYTFFDGDRLNSAGDIEYIFTLKNNWNECTNLMHSFDPRYHTLAIIDHKHRHRSVYIKNLRRIGDYQPPSSESDTPTSLCGCPAKQVFNIGCPSAKGDACPNPETPVSKSESENAEPKGRSLMQQAFDMMELEDEKDTDTIDIKPIPPSFLPLKIQTPGNYGSSPTDFKIPKFKPFHDEDEGKPVPLWDEWIKEWESERSKNEKMFKQYMYGYWVTKK